MVDLLQSHTDAIIDTLDQKIMFILKLLVNFMEVAYIGIWMHIYFLLFSIFYFYFFD